MNDKVLLAYLLILAALPKNGIKTRRTKTELETRRVLKMVSNSQESDTRNSQETDCLKLARDRLNETRKNSDFTILAQILKTDTRLSDTRKFQKLAQIFGN